MDDQNEIFEAAKIEIVIPNYVPSILYIEYSLAITVKQTANTFFLSLFMTLARAYLLSRYLRSDVGWSSSLAAYFAHLLSQTI